MYFRTAHNELEKNRRAHLRNYLDILKDLVPSTANNSRNTTLLLLSRARDHVLVCPFVFISIFFKYLKKIWKKSLFLSSKKEKQYRLGNVLQFSTFSIFFYKIYCYFYSFYNNFYLIAKLSAKVFE